MSRKKQSKRRPREESATAPAPPSPYTQAFLKHRSVAQIWEIAKRAEILEETELTFREYIRAVVVALYCIAEERGATIDRSHQPVSERRQACFREMESAFSASEFAQMTGDKAEALALIDRGIAFMQQALEDE